KSQGKLLPVLATTPMARTSRRITRRSINQAASHRRVLLPGMDEKERHRTPRGITPQKAICNSVECRPCPRAASTIVWRDVLYSFSLSDSYRHTHRVRFRGQRALARWGATRCLYHPCTTDTRWRPRAHPPGACRSRPWAQASCPPRSWIRVPAKSPPAWPGHSGSTAVVPAHTSPVHHTSYTLPPFIFPIINELIGYYKRKAGNGQVTGRHSLALCYEYSYNLEHKTGVMPISPDEHHAS